MCAAFEKENKPGVRVSELESANETELQGVAVSEKITDSTSALQMFPRDCQLLLIKRIIISHPEKTYLRNGIEGVDPMEYGQWAVLSYEKVQVENTLAVDILVGHVSNGSFCSDQKVHFLQSSSCPLCCMQ